MHPFFLFGLSNKESLYLAHQLTLNKSLLTVPSLPADCNIEDVSRIVYYTFNKAHTLLASLPVCKFDRAF